MGVYDPPMFNEILPAVYRRLRLRTKLSQTRLADRLGVHRVTVCNYESGKARPDEGHERALLELATCSREELAELLCERLSELLEKRVLITPEAPGQPSTVLGRARALLSRGRSNVPEEMFRTLHNHVHAHQHLCLMLERSSADLDDLAEACCALAEPSGES